MDHGLKRLLLQQGQQNLLSHRVSHKHYECVAGCELDWTQVLKKKTDEPSCPWTLMWYLMHH